MSKEVIRTKKGDTIIGTIFSISIFSIVMIATISTMNNGLVLAQNALEITMARNEIDAQAETLRFIHNSFLSERDSNIEQQEYIKLWQKIAEVSANIPPLNYEDCKTAIEGARKSSNSFITNTRLIYKGKISSSKIIDDSNHIIRLNADPDRITEASVYPRIIYRKATHSGKDSGEYLLENTKAGVRDDELDPFDNVARAEGIWIQGVPQSDSATTKKDPEFYDFHIRTCWYSSGSSIPNTIGTILRLYNPKYSEEGKNVR